MADSSELNIDHVAQLARLTLTPEEKAEYTRQLGEVLHHIGHLAEVDVSKVEPTAHAFSVCNVWGEDEPRAGLPVEVALQNAPRQRQGMFAVPRVME
jgi:aspartyl-tRNA(Asn)/glutamyl-tRNA(Gln) amidotransferase subunit C